MELTATRLLLSYSVFMSLIGFVLMGIDKSRAIHRAWRIPEKTLILTALLGGGIGSLLGMTVFRHKTKHIKFVVLFPITAILDFAMIIKLIT